MKRLNSLIALLALGASAAVAQVATMNLSGQLPAEYNGKKIYLINLDTRERLDSAVVKAGKVAFATEVGANETVPAALTAGNRKILNFILEPGTATLNEAGQVKGTPLNNINEGVGEALDSLSRDYKAKQKEIMQRNVGNDEKMKAAEELYNQMAMKSGDLIVDTYKANKTNAVGYMLLLQIADGMTEAEIDEMLDGAVDWIKESNAVASFKEFARNVEKTAPGKMFTDFSVKTSSGKTVKLSDYVGKGDYVVLDFFASWCGPCRREMPTLKQIYSKYDGKGLKVVGLAVWDEPADTKKCVKELALPWTIIDNAQAGPTEIYGVSGIPHIIVFGPDGTIVARNLRGDELVAKVDELLAK